ncbi:MAG TPA: hypothetical protein VIH03_06705 [Nitrososphaerales archaeon]
MKSRSYWKSHYVVETDTDAIERSIKLASFTSDGREFELVYFERDRHAPNILISPGSGGHSYVFAELAYQMYLRNYNVFIMPKHGGYTISELVARHGDAVRHIANNFNNRIGVFAEGLGGFVTFYLALSDEPLGSMALQNSPAILTEKKFQDAILGGDRAANRRKKLLPLLRILLKISPKVRLPISLYLNWKELIDTKEENREIETRLVEKGYLKDPDFDKWYPLSAIMSLLSTPPPNSVADLKIPTMFMVAKRGFGGRPYVDYLKDLYERLPSIKKKMVEVDGSVYWMLSHPKDAAKVICGWFDETLQVEPYRKMGIERSIQAIGAES